MQVSALHIFSIFFGISQPKLPTSNFARIILITFVYFCLVIRVAYQGVQYELICKDLRKPAPKTIDQVFEYNYSIKLWVFDDGGYETMSEFFFQTLDISQK
jgi:hypothetical protein